MLILLYILLGAAYFTAFAIVPIVEHNAQKKRDKAWEDYFNQN